MALKGTRLRPLGVPGVGSDMVEARGVVIATILAALVLVGLLGMAVQRYSPHTIQDEACRSGQLPASQCQ